MTGSSPYGWFKAIRARTTNPLAHHPGMTKIRRAPALAASAAILASLGLSAVAAPAGATTRPAWTKNCTALNQKFAHGVGRADATDHTSGTPPVTTFLRSNRKYKTAMSFNKGLDRDGDKIACEKA